MDKLFINNLEVESGETLLISAELSLNLKDAGDSDRLSRTVDVVEIHRELEKVFYQSNNKLIESCAEEMATSLLLNHSLVKHVSLTITKPRISAGITLEREWHTVYIGLGSNLGDRLSHLKSALAMIDNTELSRVTKKSKVYETEPYGNVEQDKFLNAVAEVETLLTPKALIRELLRIEAELKRARLVHWGPRTIDLDILFYDDNITSFEEAVIPHPRLHERLFVLKPLCDIAPYHIHPILNERCYRIAESVKDQDEPCLYGDDL